MQEQEVIIHQQQAETIGHKPVPKAQEIEFLEKYEIKNWEFSPRLYKILAASAVFNILALFVFAQTNVLQARACDSPWVNRVCQVLDTVYLGSTILNTDSEFVSKPYEKTELEDAEIVWINQTGTEPLNYPEDYFAIANPESQFTAMQDPTLMNPDSQGFENFPPPSTNFTPTTPMTATPPASMNLPPQRLPPPAKNQITIPDNIIGDNPIGNNTRKGKNAKPENKKPDEDATAKNKTDEKEPESKQPGIKSDPVKGVEVNRKPFDDFGIKVIEKLSNKEVDLTQQFEVVMDGAITKDGKIDTDPKKSRFTKTVGDEQMILVAKEAIEAIGQSGVLGYLSVLDVEKVNLRMVQTDEKLIVVITSDQKSPQQANTKASALRMVIDGAKKFANTDDEKALLDGATVTSNSKNFLINFEISKEIAQPMIKRALDKIEAKRKEAEQKPNSTAQTENANKNTGK